RRSGPSRCRRSAARSSRQGARKSWPTDFVACSPNDFRGSPGKPLLIGLGPLRKYLLLHQHVPAPPDETTGQPMGLELAGTLTSVGGVRLATPEGKAWLQDRRERQYGLSRPDETTGLLPVEGSLEIEIYA